MLTSTCGFTNSNSVTVPLTVTFLPIFGPTLRRDARVPKATVSNNAAEKNLTDLKFHSPPIPFPHKRTDAERLSTAIICCFSLFNHPKVQVLCWGL